MSKALKDAAKVAAVGVAAVALAEAFGLMDKVRALALRIRGVVPV